LNQRFDQNKSVSLLLQRGAAEEKCFAGRGRITLIGKKMNENGFDFAANETGRSAGTIISPPAGGDGRGGKIIHEYEKAKGNFGSSFSFPFTVIETVLPSRFFGDYVRYTCEARISFDVFVTGPAGVDPFALRVRVSPKVLENLNPDASTGSMPSSEKENFKEQLKKPRIRAKKKI
jgi:hypothetical protein